ncbi:MAG TPA: type II toxin-antitoxin system HicA family toxin [Chloroflexota bacterium]|nr:type II toxin-antitoxin system HicA family toxin [Chloroflexota bacterium]
MSPKLPRITVRELLRALRRDGWEDARQRGSHVQFAHPSKTGLVTVPLHTGKTIPPKILASILEPAELSADDLVRLL